MKIVQTPVRFYPYTGGVENYALDISKELVRLGNKVKVICANEPKSDIKNLNGFRIERLDYLCKIANTNLTLILPFRLWKEEFDIIHTYLPTPWSADWSAIIAKLRGKKVVISYCNDITGNGAGNIISKIYNNTLLKLTLKLADKIITIGPNYLQTSKYLKKYSSKVQFIPIGVNRKIFKKIDIKKQNNTIFFLSILDEYHAYKGLDYLLEAIKSVKKEIPNIKLIVGGKGKLLEYYKVKTKKLGIENNVEFQGFIPDEKLVECYNKYEVFVLPSTDSTQEGFGIVLLEALACGTPVITTNIVGIAKKIEEYKAGIIVEPKNIEALSKAIVEILKNRNEFSKNISILINKFDIKRLVQKIIDCYHEITN